MCYGPGVTSVPLDPTFSATRQPLQVKNSIPCYPPISNQAHLDYIDSNPYHPTIEKLLPPTALTPMSYKL